MQDEQPPSSTIKGESQQVSVCTDASLVRKGTSTKSSKPNEEIKNLDISVIDKLNTLKKLHEEGMITQDEYDKENHY